MWPRRPRLPHAQHRRTSVPKDGRDTIDTCCAPGPNIATVWACPTPVYIHTARPGTNNTHTHTHTARVIVLCAFCDPHAHKETRSNEARQECSHRSANTLKPIHHMATTHQTDDKSKGRKRRGTSAKGSVLMLTCVPLPHLVLPLSGCACSGTPTMATRGEARGHWLALAQNPLLMYPFFSFL